MYQEFHEYPEACANTVKIAEMCNVELPIGQHFFPVIAAPDETIDNETFLAIQSREGLEKRWELISENKIKKGFTDEQLVELKGRYEERMVYELGIIKQMGFSDYFLIVADFINWAKDHGIPVGPGRGSAAGSLVAYAIRITDIDPIEYDLLFERFLNPERISMPDVDVDFCEARREEVIEYVRNRYAVEGGYAVSQIITFGTLKAKAAVKDVARAYGMSYGDADRIAKLIPNVLGIKLAEAIDQEPRLAGLIKSDREVAKVMDISQRLEGLNRHASIHAAGVVISDGRPLDNHLPLYRGANDEVVTQYDMSGVESIGLIKFDFLGLKNLTLIQNCLDMIRQNHGVDVDMARIPFDDEKTFKLLCAGDTLGVFQLESSGMREVMMKLKPSVFDDVIALVALYRPGPLQGGVVDSFIDRKHGREAIKYIFDELEPILKSTYGVCIYQEQVMQIANVVANYSLGEADKLRRAMGKKKLDEMARQRIRFLDGAKENGFDTGKAEELFDTLEQFAKYGFNKSHSAAYGLIAYQTGWLKANYRHEYMAALLTADSGNSEKVLLYLNDSRSSGIDVLPPHVNESLKSFSVVNQRIRFGLAAIKGIGDAPIDGIIEERVENGPFESFVDFSERIDFKGKRINRRVMEALIKCGAFDEMGLSRAAMFKNLELTMQHGQRVQDEKASAQFSLFSAGGSDVTPKYEVSDIPEWGEKERLALEKGVLGLYISGHPLNRYHSDLERITTSTIADLKDKPAGSIHAVAGIVNSRRDMVTKKGKRMSFVVVEDLTGEIEVSFFPKVFEQAVELLDSEVPLLVRGEVEKTENSTRYTAKEIFSLAEIRAERAKSIHLDLTSDEMSEQCVKDMVSILNQNKGRCAAYLHIRIPGQSECIFQLPDELSLAPSEDLVEALERLFGQNPTTFR
jgi:DNA polymerase-3 subunit alpha